MKLLLLGKDGQVGWELQRSLIALGQLHAVGRKDCDLSNSAAVRDLVQQIKPDVIINAAAYTAVDKAESEPELAHAINAQAPAILAAEAAELGAWLIHYSTDYVFDGTKAGRYQESDLTAPLSVYGRSKLQAEIAIAQSGCKNLIFRTSWVFAARGGNFAKTMLKLARDRDALKVVGDQYGAPTSAELIADVTALCLSRILCLNKTQPSQLQDVEALSGIYHLVAAGETNWHAYAQYVISKAAESGQILKCPAQAIAAIPASEYPTPAKRPANSRLSTAKLEQAFGLTMPAWEYHVARMLDEILA